MFNKNCIYDYHIHIGQYFNLYFYPDRVFSALKKNGVKEFNFSSTSSCIYCKESIAIKDNYELIKKVPTAIELYDSIKSEISQSLDIAQKIEIKAHPYYWVVPEILQSGISLEKVFNDINYDGFKIHTRAQNWDLSQKSIYELADEVFLFAKNHNKKILIHTGENGLESPLNFECLIKKYNTVLVQLAHCKNIKAIAYMLNNYENVFMDTSCAPIDVIEQLELMVNKDKIKFGSDFPCILWYDSLQDAESDPSEEILTSLYKKI